MTAPEPWVDTPAVAIHLNKSVLTIRRWASAGEIPGIKKRGEWMFQLSVIDAHLNNQDRWGQSSRSRARRRVS